MRKTIISGKKHYYLLLLLIVTFLSTTLFSQDKKDIEKKASSYFKASASYLSNSVYNGRKDSLLTPYITPSIGYYNKSGFYGTASLSYLSNSSGSRIDLYSFDIGYDFSFNDKFIGSIYADKSFYNQASTSIQSDIKGSIGSTFTYDFNILQFTAGADMVFAQKADISTNFGLSHAFNIGEEGNQFTITPTVLTNLSTLNFYEGYTNRVAGKKANLLYPNIKSIEVSTAVQNKKFTLLDYELSIPITYDAKNFGFFLTPTLAIPQNPIYTITTTTIVFKNGTQTSQTVNSTPPTEKKLSNTFYAEFGLYIKF